MPNRKVLVITHGHFGIELVKSAEMIMGAQENIKALGLVPGQSVDDLRQQAFALLEEYNEQGAQTIICCDLLGGSPSNVALSCLSKGDYKILMGVSMPMLIELIQNFDEEDLETVVKGAAEAAQAGVVIKDRSLLKG